MANTSDPTGIARVVDDWIEEVAVGTAWWVLALVFGAGMPVLLGAGALIFGIRYPSGTYGIAFVIGILVALALRLIARERERYRAKTMDRSRDVKALRGLSWSEFEIVVGEIVRRQGYVVKERGGFQADEGIDLIAEGPKGRIAIQCKQWKVWRVGPSRARDLYGTVKRGGFTEGWLVTCGVFASPAKSWAKGLELRLIEGPELAALAQGISTTSQLSSPNSVNLQAPATKGLECPNCGSELQRQTNGNDGSQYWRCGQGCGWTFNDPPAQTGDVLCDRGHAMVRRRTKRGVAFWGCSTYPRCESKRLFRGSGRPIVIALARPQARSTVPCH
jgi:restriction system protein